MTHRATEIAGIETTNDWRFFRLEKGGPLSRSGAVDVVVSVFEGVPPRSPGVPSRVPPEVRIYARGPDGRIRDACDWLFEEVGHADHEACLRAAGYEPS
jgi:hypothetical protein